MKKVFLLTAIAGIFAFSNVNAQKKDPAMNGPKLGIGAEFAFPVGNFGDFQNFGYGGSLNYQHPVAPNLNLTGSAGYINFQSKDLPFVGKVNSGFIPVKAGARYFLAENFYVNGELGASFATGSNNSGTAFVYSPGIGVEFPVSDKASVDLGGRYEGWSNNGTASFFGIRAAFNFGL
ncbi:outer membrane protein [Pedobacter gandavensis]|uniref:Outer membrane beta-barrel protein n=1 Tax=Pedobacter gandavensis TaxID=2679963 RepID=A0ABR6F1U5_9SPHI|nr:outer membrane beta-barrel protein [Pedobacter gandavensis]MBB2151508.1 outer membrane beta-barrel protein [Pedobacter gandavensis]